ncbi:hypothetical protein JT359_20695 [Candidatus Poribacteria bacterium]|nr:hypothetical protein [Candidatus Poribacteria bacterium]
MRKLKNKIREFLRHLIIQNTLAVITTTLLSITILLSGSFFVVLLITGCSDTPYVGSMLTPDDLDKYFYEPDTTTLCLTNGFDERCVTLVPKGRDPRLPIIHIYPKKVTYIFYHDGIPIIRAERPRDDVGTEQGGGNIGGTRDDDNGGNNNGGINTDNGNNDNGNNGNNGNGNNDNGNGEDTNTPQIPPENNPNPSGHNPPDNSLSHFINNTNGDGFGWLVSIYYPHNYVKDDDNDGVEDNPRNSYIHPDGFGFTLSVTGGTRETFSQAVGSCFDEDNNNRDDYLDVPCDANGTNYSAQFFVSSTAEKITISITWTAGMYSGQTQTFNIMKEVNMANWDSEEFDPGHTHQDGW